ncbi:MAG TPA: ferritin-like domain-containing protein, partial [Frankiaceae bacterium]|nr:ferritin-like domain-containing protein [Frankiaceae bacterium]
AATRIDWSLPVDPGNPLDTPAEMLPIHGSAQYAKLSPREVDEMRQHTISWQFSQFLHGEQGAAICAARLVESVPDIDAKFYAATQVMDEARHAETYARFLQEKIGLVYPINVHLQALLNDTLSDSRWDMPYLGMQVLIEGVALAAFGMLREAATSPLPKSILAYVMQDEARHVAFGRLALKDAYRDLTTAEREEREDFIVEGCYLLRDRFQAREVWETLGYDVRECVDFVEQSPIMRTYRTLLFTRIVPIVKDIGLWGERIQKAYADMGVLDYAAVDIDAMMRHDEDVAEAIDEEKALRARADQVHETIAAGAAS